jgi:poly(A) polymerase
MKHAVDSTGRVLRDNVWGPQDEDAARRDFTINALFYDPINHKLLDYVDGQKDIDARVIRMIGDPKERFLEDPIRSLRAMRLSHKLNFSLEPELRAAMTATAIELSVAVLPRRREEYLKILRLKEPGRVWAELMDMGILEKIMPGLAELFQNQEQAILFENYLLEIPGAGIDLGSPLELFSAFLYSFIRAKHPDGDFNPADIESNPRWMHFMRDELGMFKVEMAVFLKCLELMPSLEKIETYHKKGGRRKLGFLRNESLPLALKIGLLDRTLTSSEYYFWVDEIHRNSEEIWASRPRD